MTLKNCFTSILLFSLLIISNVNDGISETLYHQLSLSAGNLSTDPVDRKASVPGILAAKYKFNIAKDFVPYLGTGLAYSYQPDTKSGDVTNVKTGLAAQLGFNYFLGNNLTLKLDYKYLSVSPELPRGDLGSPPQSLGIGLDIRF